MRARNTKDKRRRHCEDDRHRLASILLGLGLATSLQAQPASLLTVVTNPTPNAEDKFGFALAAVGEEHFVIGAHRDDTSLAEAGIAYLFNRTGALVTVFHNPEASLNDQFGYAVGAVGTNKVVVGALHGDAGGADVGGAYLFDLSGTLLRTFNNPAPAKSGGWDDFYGSAVAGVGADKVVVGAFAEDSGGVSQAGVAYLFSTNGSLLHTFTNPTPAIAGRFGEVVAALGENHVLISAKTFSTHATHAGAVYLFNLSGALLTTFTNATAAESDIFGEALAAVGADKVLISAPYREAAGLDDVGEAYLFDASGTLLTTFTNPVPAASDYFGMRVASVGTDKVLVGGAYRDLGALNAGVAYLFDLQGQLLTTLTNPSPAAHDFFGLAVAGLGADRMVVASGDDDLVAVNSGAAFLYQLLPSPPRLGALLMPGALTLTWPTNAGNFVAQAVADLTSTNWTAIAESPNVTDGKYALTVPLTNSQQFFRLQKE